MCKAPPHDGVSREYCWRRFHGHLANKVNKEMRKAALIQSILPLTVSVNKPNKYMAEKGTKL